MIYKISLLNATSNCMKWGSAVICLHEYLITFCQTITSNEAVYSFITALDKGRKEKGEFRDSKFKIHSYYMNDLKNVFIGPKKNPCILYPGHWYL